MSRTQVPSETASWTVRVDLAHSETPSYRAGASSCIRNHRTNGPPKIGCPSHSLLSRWWLSQTSPRTPWERQSWTPSMVYSGPLDVAKVQRVCIVLRIELALVFLEEEKVMQHSSVSISLSFWEPRYQSSRRLLTSPTHLHKQTRTSQPTQ